MGLEPTDRVRDREAYIKKDGMLESWEKCLVTIDGDELVVRQKEVSRINIRKLRISAGVKKRAKKFAFLLEIKKKLYYVGMEVEKAAQQLHQALKQMVLEHADSVKEEDNKILQQSEIHDDSMDK